MYIDKNCSYLNCIESLCLNLLIFYPWFSIDFKKCAVKKKKEKERKI